MTGINEMAQEEVIKQAKIELAECGVIYLDTGIKLINLGLDPMDIQEEFEEYNPTGENNG